MHGCQPSPEDEAARGRPPPSRFPRSARLGTDDGQLLRGDTSASMAHDFVEIEAIRECAGLDRPVPEVFMATNTRGRDPHSTVGAVIDLHHDLPRGPGVTARAVRDGDRSWTTGGRWA